jgi:hypothetical protein
MLIINKKLYGKAVNTFIMNAFGSQVRDVQEDSSLFQMQMLYRNRNRTRSTSVHGQSRIKTCQCGNGQSRWNAWHANRRHDPNDMAQGQQLFNKPGEITFAAQGGIMSTNKAFQRVA